MIRPPASRLGPLTLKERAIIRSVSPVEGKYEEAIDRESAYELLQKQAEQAASAAAAKKGEEAAEKERLRLERVRAKHAPLHEQMARQIGRSMQRQVSNKIANQIIRGVLGGLFKGR